jgi:hypothetical protein
MPRIEAANKAVTTTKSPKIQKSHKLSGQAHALLGMTRSKGVSSASHHSSERAGGLIAPRADPDGRLLAHPVLIAFSSSDFIDLI